MIAGMYPRWLIRSTLAVVVSALLLEVVTVQIASAGRVDLGRQPVVLLLGDSNFFGALGHELTRALRSQGFEVFLRAKPGSGLAHPSHYDWFERAPRYVRQYHPDVTVFLVGGNDGQSLKPQGLEGAPVRIPWSDEHGWREEYGRRVDTLARSVIAEGSSFVLLSPTNRRPLEARTRMHRVVDVQRAVIDRLAGAWWVDTWSLTSTGDGLYQARGPSVDTGAEVRFRRRDGIHLTQQGARALGMLPAK